MKSLRVLCAALVPLTFGSCSSVVDGIFDSAFESKSDRRIDSDTKRMQAGEPLKYHSSERRLRIAREDRMYNDLRGSF